MLPALLTGSLLGALSLAALGWLPAPHPWWVALALLGSAAAVGALPGRPLVWFLTMALALFGWGGLLAPGADEVDVQALRTGLARLTLQVGRGGCSDRGCWCEAELVYCEPLEPSACVAVGTLLGVASEHELPLGGLVTALGTLKPRVFYRNGSGAAAWPDTRPQVQAALEPGSEPRVDALSPLDAALFGARQRIRERLLRTLRAPHAGIARALILGEGAAVERELNDAIRNAGVSHVLAVSGMHVTLLVGALVLAARWLWLRTPLALHWEAKRAAAVLGLVLAPALARLCGGSPSAVRAAWTSTLMYVVVALGARPSPLAVSALVVAVHAVLAPRDALHPGFVLSVLATAALLTNTRARDGRASARAASGDAPPAHAGGGVLAAAHESLRAWLATAPFLLLCFGQTSLVALLANVALLPLGTALVPLAAAHVATSQLALAGLVPTGAVFELASAAFVEAARVCAQLDPGLSIPPPTPCQLVALSVLSASLMLRAALRTRLTVALLTALVVALSEWSLRHALARDELRVTFVDVGQGDATLIETGDGHAALIDGGGSLGGAPDPGQAALLPMLRARRIGSLDLVVLSHPHPDHYGGLAAVLDHVPAPLLWDTGQAEAEASSTDDAVVRLLDRARRRGARVAQPGELCGKTHALGGATLQVLAPCPAFDPTRGPNDNSLVVRLVHGARSFLFTGDIERAGEAALRDTQLPLRSDVLKVGHHGSRTSSGEPLLDAVSPRLAVASAGRANRFGHPHAEIVERLTQHTRLLRTDLVGGIEVRSDGRTLRVSSARDPRLEVLRAR
jgi:competence protein ComEC